MKIKPKKLNAGDTIGIISPAGVLKDREKLYKAVKYFEQKGYRVKTAPHALDKDGYLAGKDLDRASDLEAFFSDDEINAIFCSRGGYGTSRILNRLNWDIIRHNPKIFVGFSDITTLLNNFNTKSNLVTFHGPLAAIDFGRDEIDEYTEKAFWDIVTGQAQIPHHFQNVFEYHCLKPGKVEGELAGGNMAVLCGLLGTPYFPDLRDKILLLEDISESVYKVDRMLCQLKLAGVFEQVAGVLFAEFSSIPEPEEGETERINIIDILAEQADEVNIPVGYGFPAGHSVQKATLPVGVRYSFDSSGCDLQIIEDFVS